MNFYLGAKFVFVIITWLDGFCNIVFLANSYLDGEIWRLFLYYTNVYRVVAVKRVAQICSNSAQPWAIALFEKFHFGRDFGVVIEHTNLLVLCAVRVFAPYIDVSMLSVYSHIPEKVTCIVPYFVFSDSGFLNDFFH